LTSNNAALPGQSGPALSCWRRCLGGCAPRATQTHAVHQRARRLLLVPSSPFLERVLLVTRPQRAPCPVLHTLCGRHSGGGCPACLLTSVLGTRCAHGPSLGTSLGHEGLSCAWGFAWGSLRVSQSLGRVCVCLPALRRRAAHGTSVPGAARPHCVSLPLQCVCITLAAPCAPPQHCGAGDDESAGSPMLATVTWGTHSAEHLCAQGLHAPAAAAVAAAVARTQGAAPTATGLLQPTMSSAGQQQAVLMLRRCRTGQGFPEGFQTVM
jgi:hypothetical protein